MNLTELIKNQEMKLLTMKQEIRMEEVLSNIEAIGVVQDCIIIKFGKDPEIEKPDEIVVGESRKHNVFIAKHPKLGTYYANNQRQFAEKFNLNQPGISRCLTGKQSKYKGWSFRYLEGDLKKKAEMELGELPPFVRVF